MNVLKPDKGHKKTLTQAAFDENYVLKQKMKSVLIENCNLRTENESLKAQYKLLKDKYNRISKCMFGLTIVYMFVIIVMNLVK